MALPENYMTPEAYLKFERSSEIKHEYYGGEVFAMTGASRQHNLIVGNCAATLHTQLRKTPCEVFLCNMRVKIGSNALYIYPDISVVCGEPEFEDDFVDTLLNPTVIIEVLSPSTELYDRGRKFQHYRTLTSLQEYVLIAQDSYRVEHFIRQPNDEWLLSDAVTLDATIQLPSIQCQLALSDVYEKVTFEEA
ncbi:MAG TPA: Uma2 family endonuclease [Oceanobacillus sp.]|nr:Uma2 family endonuclease [Oceanobacillus sp.]